MRRRPNVTTQVGAPVAAASLGVGGAYLSIDLRVGIPLLALGVVVTCWIVWNAWREDKARKAVGRLLVGASRRLSEYEDPGFAPDLEGAIAFMNREAEWVHAALGHMEARLLLDTRRQMLPTVPGLSSAQRRLRGFRANLTDLHKRLPLLDVERDFDPSDWTDRY